MVEMSVAYGFAQPRARSGSRPQRQSPEVLAADLVTLSAAALSSLLVEPTSGQGAFGWALIYALTCLIVMRARGLYDFHLGASVVTETGRVIVATALAAMVVISLRAFIVGGVHVGLLGARLWVYSAVFVTAGRAGRMIQTRWFPDRMLVTRPTLVIGAGHVGRALARRLRDRPDLGLTPIGHVDDAPRPEGEEDLPLLGGTGGLEALIAKRGITHVIITFALSSDVELLALMRRCKRAGAEVLVVPRLYEEMTRRLTIQHAGGIPLIRVGQTDPQGWQFGLKYAVDRLVAAAMLIVLLPVMLLIALIVLISSGRPILFRQKRAGLDGGTFSMLKFRSMSGAPDAAGENDASWAAAIRGDAVAADKPAADRVTPVGGILRKLSLDELPQLINVLRGEMSLVGPRPERARYARDFETLIYRYSDRYRLRPGITGWAQVQKLRGETSLADRVEWDNFYIDNWSGWLDIKILLMTFPAALLGGFVLNQKQSAPLPAEVPEADLL
jgi:exopolysaccharide biosynthesis polyprenyl glycosylphosphotransferase